MWWIYSKTQNERPDSANIAPATPNEKEIRKIGAKSGAKYFKIIFVLLTFAIFNIFINGLLLSAKLSLLIILDIPIQPVIDITSIKTRLFASMYETKAKRKKMLEKLKIGQLQ